MSLYNLTNQKLSIIKEDSFRLERNMQAITENNLEYIFGLKASGFRGPEFGRWKWRGNWYKGRHFHLGKGSLGKHHLPQQFGNWFKNLKNLF